jgi:hypothetical protein
MIGSVAILLDQRERRLGDVITRRGSTSLIVDDP